MADLNERDAGGTTKIVGADPDTGVETFFADVTSEGELKISSFANITYSTATKSVGNVTEVLAAVGGANLANRKTIVAYNRGPQTVYYGPTGVTSTTGIPIEKDEVVTFAIGDNIDVYFITGSSTASVTIEEYA